MLNFYAHLSRPLLSRLRSTLSNIDRHSRSLTHGTSSRNLDNSHIFLCSLVLHRNKRRNSSALHIATRKSLIHPLLQNEPWNFNSMKLSFYFVKLVSYLIAKLILWLGIGWLWQVVTWQHLVVNHKININDAQLSISLPKVNPVNLKFTCHIFSEQLQQEKLPQKRGQPFHFIIHHFLY